MQPERISEFLSAYVDGELNARQLCALDDLLARSPEARALLEKLQSDAAHLRSLPRLAAPNDSSERILDALADKPVERLPRCLPMSERTLPPWVGLPFAAAVLTAVFGTSYWYFSPPRAGPRSEQSLVQRPATEAPMRVAQATEPPKPQIRHEMNTSPPSPTPPPPVSDSSDQGIAHAVPPVKPAKDLESLTGKAAPKIEGFAIVESKIGVSIPLRDLEGKLGQEKILPTLKGEDAFRLEVTGSANAKSLEVLTKALQSHGFQVLTEELAQQRAKMHQSLTDYVVVADDVTSNELAEILGRLGKADRDADPKRADAARFGDVMLLPLTPEDHKEMAKLLGTDAGPVADPTGTRQALILSYNPMRPLPATSKEIKRFLNGRGKRRPGSLQILLVLRAVTT